ncbi:MAG: inorganic phosphate transporter [Armatimonadetes bacterium]|nr:inorganic phosphate transporter [Armatimonadota bacterium]
MKMSLALIITIVVVALVFDFLNGFHDAANSIATVVATKVLTPFRAVLWAAFFNLVAPLFFGVAVADTIGKTVNSNIFKPDEMIMVVFAALCGAIIWNIITWYFGLPTSSSHALIGGLAGAGLTASQLIYGSIHGVLNWEKIDKTAMFIILSPMIGMIVGFTIMVAVMWMFRRATPSKVDGWFRRLQLVSAAAYSWGHGTNDAQKTMGVISIVLVASGHLAKLPNGHIPVPWEIKVLCAAAIALGTMTGGWRIVKTMGLGITKLKPVGGFCAETAGAITIIGASLAGIPVSTTHTITGAIVGVGATNRLSAVRWGIAGRIVWAWVLTMPLAAMVSSGTYLIIYYCTP